MSANYDQIPDPNWRHPAEYIDGDDIDEDDLYKLGRCNPEAVEAILRVIIAPDIGNQTTVQTITCRAVALAHVLHVPGIGDKSLTHLAEKIGVTKSLLSSYCVKIRDFANLDCRPGRCQSARLNMSVAKLWGGSSYQTRDSDSGERE